MNGFILRKMAVFNRIEKLSADEKKRAHKLYEVLDKIEWFTIIPFYFGMLAWLALPFLAGRLPGSEVVFLLYALILYAIGVFVFKKLIFNHYRDRQVLKLRTMMISDHNCRNTLETLKRLDPDMARNIKKHIVQPV